MGATLAIAKRDFNGFFGTAVGWISACVIFAVSGVLFYIVTSQLLDRGQAVDPVSEILSNIYGFMNYISIFIVPVFTMRIMSEELGNGTYRLQASAPISSWSIVLGKFLGVMFFFGVLGVLMLIYPLYVSLFANPDYRVMFSGWVGLMLNMAAIVSIGMFIGSLTKNVVISYLGAAFFIILFLFSSFFPFAPEWYKRSVNLLELGNEFTRGMIKTSSLAIYLAIIGLFLFLSRLVLETKRWRV
jgi:ABC-2 type transport system permease protein